MTHLIDLQQTVSPKITLTLTDCDPEVVERVLRALRCEGAGAEFLVTRDTCPVGHTYRELCDALCRGELTAVKTAKGLVVTSEALDQYRRHKAGRRRGGRPRPSATTADAEARRALEARGIVTREPER